MSGLSLPVDRPTGRALLVASASNRTRPHEILGGLGFDATDSEDPYAAMVELCARPLVYRAVILSLASLYREELSIIPAIKSRFPHVDVWIAHTDGRQAALAEAMRLGADGLLAEDGLHRVAGSSPPQAVPSLPPPAPVAVEATPPEPPQPAPEEPVHEMISPDEPSLTPDELRALLHEQSSVRHDED
jgi:hypothetical protein